MEPLYERGEGLYVWYLGDVGELHCAFPLPNARQRGAPPFLRRISKQGPQSLSVKDYTSRCCSASLTVRWHAEREGCPCHSRTSTCGWMGGVVYPRFNGQEARGMVGQSIGWQRNLT